MISPLNVVPQKNEKNRLILDLREVNDDVVMTRLKFERLQDVEFVGVYGDVMVGTDFTNGYWQVPMHPDAFEYLGFAWEGQYVVFCVLPFGLATAPWCFAKVMKALSGHVRSVLSAQMQNYLDDYAIFLVVYCT